MFHNNAIFCDFQQNSYLNFLYSINLQYTWIK